MRIYVKVIPNSKQKKITKISSGEYQVKLTAPPKEGKANKMLIQMLANHFSVAKSLVSIVGGKSAKIKIVDILL